MALLTLAARDRLLILAALASVAAVAWTYLYKFSVDMTGMVSAHPWTSLDVALMFVMWTVMMVGMMVPTATRAVLIYAGIARRADAAGTPVASTYWFVFGYLLMWTAFSIAATAIQLALTEWGLLSPMAVSISRYLGGGLLIAAGIYQLTPWKEACLSHCQSPAMFLAARFKSGARNAVMLGARHGAYCLGCCWLLMGLLFLGGVMNLLWIAAIAGCVLLEKLLPPSVRLARFIGIAMIFAGLAYFSVA